ncbi:RNA polymerase sigma factor [Paenibacillus bovis]|uniref:RNA polymerase subunit sigma n=1 Tax=Paenibacillus bovis TaxID=1616788 RepID=A0A172ZB92_9BACL|nr:RNA polymerase sigma factor [Paenibacillus bovis]ANF94911.1 RNA polymerase subunit sigma [Paenibacillus bovis]
MTDKELFETYNRDVYRTCYYMVHHASDAEDLCQDVFITIFRSDWQQIQQLRAWIIKVAVNLCLNHLRRRRSLRDKLLSYSQFWARPVPDTPDLLTANRESEAEWAIHFSRLPVKIRTVISLRYVHDLSLNEIAGILEIPVGTVKSRQHKGLQLLRHILEQQGQHSNLKGEHYETY